MNANRNRPPPPPSASSTCRTHTESVTARLPAFDRSNLSNSAASLHDYGNRSPPPPRTLSFSARARSSPSRDERCRQTTSVNLIPRLNDVTARILIDGVDTRDVRRFASPSQDRHAEDLLSTSIADNSHMGRRGSQDRLKRRGRLDRTRSRHAAEGIGRRRRAGQRLRVEAPASCDCPRAAEESPS